MGQTRVRRLYTRGMMVLRSSRSLAAILKVMVSAAAAGLVSCKVIFSSRLHNTFETKERLATVFLSLLVACYRLFVGEFFTVVDLV